MKSTIIYPKMRCCLKLVPLVLLVAICFCTGAAVGGKTEALSPDGGELGKAFVALADAIKSADKVRAAKLLDPTEWHLENKEPGWFAQISEAMAEYSPVGGRRQGDRATLFVVTKQPYYAMMNATYVTGGWQFDSPLPRGSSFDPSVRDCTSLPTRFPCAAKSAPDAQVSGIIQSHIIDPNTKSPLHPVVMFDGLSVRMLDKQTNTLKSTWIVLSGTGINPQMVALSHDPENVKSWLSYPVLMLNVAPDGKNAEIEYHNGYSPKTFNVTNGLSITMNVSNRINGHLKTDVKDVANFDITFDISTASDCFADQYQCGE